MPIGFKQFRQTESLSHSVGRLSWQAWPHAIFKFGIEGGVCLKRLFIVCCGADLSGFGFVDVALRGDVFARALGGPGEVGADGRLIRMGFLAPFRIFGEGPPQFAHRFA